MIEVLLSLVLAAIAIMCIIALYIASTRASGFSRHSTEAAVLGEDKVEKLRTLGAATQIGTLANGACTTGTTEVGIDGQGNTGGLYTRVYCEALEASYADIVVTVSWTDDGVPHAVTLAARRSL